ncbi:MAG: hypothetical protein HJJLKODD_01789 [Phycisphaerae bacterium]|nr:hypothetical protein [Phycisphaerae bacterium]
MSRSCFRIGRICTILALLALPLATGCGTPLTLTVTGCPTGDVTAGTGVTFTLSAANAEGVVVEEATFTTEAVGADVTDGDTASPTVTASEAGPVSVSFDAAATGFLADQDGCEYTVIADPCAGVTCDDGAFCNGEETCDNGDCVAGTPPCDEATETCNEDTDACEPILPSCEGVVCDDDGLFCNGTEACDEATGDCASSGDPCVAPDVCNEDTDACETPPPACTVDADCDNSDACDGEETCVDNECVAGTALDCDDSDACTTDSCDATAGCVNEAVTCATGEECDPATGDCVAIVCEADADCDNGIFCDGAETCDTGTGACVAGTDPCADLDCGTCDTLCTEGDDAAVCECDDCIASFDFTINQDNLSSTTGDDEFLAPLVVPQGTGTQANTLQTGDSANGLAGDDVMNASFADLAAGTSVVATLTGIETFNLTSYDVDHTVTLVGNNITGVTTINTLNSVGDISVDSLKANAAAGILGLTDAGDYLEMKWVTGASNPLTATTDELDITVSDTTAGELRITTDTNGFEIANFLSDGDLANVLSLFAVTGGSTNLKTANFDGDQNLTVTVLPNTITTIDASGMTTTFQLGGGTAAGGYTDFPSAANNLVALTGGTGNDTIIFDENLNTNDFSGATVDLGTGTDVAQASFASDFGIASPFRNTEEFRFNATASGLTVNFSGITGLATLTNDEDGTANTITLQNVPATAGVFPTLNYRGDNATTAQVFDTITYSATGATGSSDTMNINVANRGTALASGNAFTIGGGAITAAGFENVNVDVADGPVTFNGITASTLVTFDIDHAGSSNVTLGTVAPTSATFVTFDASGVSGNLSATLDWMTSGASITTGGGNDTIIVGTNSTGTTLSGSFGSGNDSFTGDSDTDCADTVSGGAGADTFDTYGGNDTITSGADQDTILYRQTTASDREDCTDFTMGAGGDVLKFDQSDLGLAGVTEYVGTTAGAAGEYIVAFTDASYASEAAAETAFTGTTTLGDGVNAIIIYHDSTAGYVKILWDTDADTSTGLGASLVEIGRLTNITTLASFLASFTTANIDNQA